MANNGSWGGPPPDRDENGSLQFRPMGLKVHYTFDKDGQVHCLARWPQILHVQVIPLDERNTIGVVDLRLCLQAVAQCSPELVGHHEDKDYTVYAFDYSEPDTPLVGQGMLSWILGRPHDPSSTSHPQVVTGRVTKNLLAIFANGIRETLEVKLKLTAVPVPKRESQVPCPPNRTNSFQFPNAEPAPSENAEWRNFIQSNPNLGQAAHVSAVSSPAPAPIRPSNSNYEARDEPAGSSHHRGPPSAIMDNPHPPAEPTGRDENEALPPSGSGGAAQSKNPSETIPSAPKPPPRAQSRPNSRASSRAPTGRPRGRPRKKAPAVEGNTSGYEDGTDGDEGPPRKKRAKTTQVAAKSNTATFGSTPESLRVAASTAGSLRNFRPVASGSEASGGSQQPGAPRAPTPVPDSRLPTLAVTKPKPTSSLSRASTAGQDEGGPFTSSYLDISQQSQNGPSPGDSTARSPSQTYSDGPSPPDIGSSPPVPRPVMYNMQSSPAPSSPTLPPMPAPQLPDSGFMSGGTEESNADGAEAGKPESEKASKAPAAAKPKPRRRGPKKQTQKNTKPTSEAEKPGPPEPASKSTDLIIETETPGPPELLPTTSLYNPRGRKNTGACQPAAPKETAVMPVPGPIATGISGSGVGSAAMLSDANPAPRADKASDNLAELEKALTDELAREQMTEMMGNATTCSTLLDREQTQDETVDLTLEPDSVMEPPPTRKTNVEGSIEPELPVVPASDPVLPQLSLPMPLPLPEHPQTDVNAPLDVRSNKNFVKKQAIKAKLEEAIAAGDMPPFCNNCGAIQTPTWRKIWIQRHQGVPADHEYSDQPGHVIAIHILHRDSDGLPTEYEMVKKTLGPVDDKDAWNEVILCNPCGIWFSKWKMHRPPEKWEKDKQRLTQVRRKRVGNGENGDRRKKARTKSDGQLNPTAGAGLSLELAGQADGAAPLSNDGTVQPGWQIGVQSTQGSGETNGGEPRGQSGPASSTHSRASQPSRGSQGSGTPGSPIALDDDDLGSTRRLLFPSPRKEGEPKVLGEVAVNIVQTTPEFPESKEGEADKENSGSVFEGHDAVDHEFSDLFGSPPAARPSTPPPSAKTTAPGAFKTPTRPTPSHRPITRSVTKSLRSTRSFRSPGMLAGPDRTPSKTPRSGALPPSSSSAAALLHRSPRQNNNNNSLPSQLLLSDDGDHHHAFFETPFTRSINQLLSEANDFMGPSSPHRGVGGVGGFGLDLSALPNLQLDDDDDDAAARAAGVAPFDFGSFLSTDDAVMPSSPAALLRSGRDGARPPAFAAAEAELVFDDEADAALWAQLGVASGPATAGEADAVEEA